MVFGMGKSNQGWCALRCGFLRVHRVGQIPSWINLPARCDRFQVALSDHRSGNGSPVCSATPAFETHAIRVVSDLAQSVRIHQRSELRPEEKRVPRLSSRSVSHLCQALESRLGPRFAPAPAGDSRYRLTVALLGHGPRRLPASGRSSRNPPRPSRQDEKCDDRAAQIGDPVLRRREKAHRNRPRG